MADSSLTEKLARHNAELQLDRIPSDVISAAKLHILDSIGCLLAGTKLEPGKLACEWAAAGSEAAAASSSIFGTPYRAPYPDAAQAMAVAAHCGEMDDIHGGAGVCIGGVIVPALLAMAENFGCTGQRFIEAAAAGYETVIRIGLSIDAPKLFARGWWPSTVCGAFGVAAAAARLLDWPAEKTANALGIASLHSGGMITGGSEGATARHFVFGRPARDGLLAIMAAEQGFTGPKRALEDPRGFCMTLCSEPRWEYLQELAQFHLPEVALKPYPCARQLHAGVEALLRILQRNGLKPESIDAIELGLPVPNASMMDRPSLTPTHAGTVGSGQYVMAVTAVRGKIDLRSFDEEFLFHPDVRSMMCRVTIVASAELDKHFPTYWPGRVKVRSGEETYVEQVIIPKGEPGNPMTAEDARQKFLSLASPIIGAQNADGAAREVDLLEQRKSLATLLDFLRVGAVRA